ncbi:MAG: hypothetical protein HGB05_14240, partial [Chloroflexi bacterium]|nr:hypothetical protein [Chloroflexota bacterium]
ELKMIRSFPKFGYNPITGEWNDSLTGEFLWSNANVSEGVVLYIDKDPVVPANGGSNANGNLTGFNYDGTNFAALPFRADFVVYFKNGYREYRTADGAGGWGMQAMSCWRSSWPCWSGW